jgi:hypothetical protein
MKKRSSINALAVARLLLSLCRAYNDAADPLSNLYEARPIPYRWALLWKQIRKAAMSEKAYRFSALAIDELNSHPRTPRVPTKHFALLMVGLTALLLLLYLQIVW